MRDKFDWLYQPPFLFANANNPEVCRKFLQLYSETPRIQHSRVTLYLIDTFGEHMEEIANGNVSVCNAEYSRELAVWDRMPLTSDPAEGYHRSTKLSKTRAHYSKMPWLISSNSLKQNLEFAYEEINSGDGGERFFEYAWRTWSSVLQTRPGRQHRPKRQPVEKSLFEFYRVGDFSRTDWSCLGSVYVDGDEPRGPVQRSVISQWVDEYLDCVLAQGYLYTFIDHHRGQVCFEVLRRSRGVDKRTFAIRKRAVPQDTHFGTVIQRYTIVGEAHRERQTARPDGDAERVDVGNMVNWRRFWDTLKQWSRSVSDMYPGCVNIDNPQLARPTMDIMNENYPTIAVLHHLLSQGWVQDLDADVIHRRDTPRCLSLKQAGPKKFYFQCLLALDRVLGLVDEMLSNQPQSYYRCLLAGHAVMPWLGDREYKRILNGNGEAPPAAAGGHHADAAAVVARDDSSDLDMLEAGGAAQDCPDAAADAAAVAFDLSSSAPSTPPALPGAEAEPAPGSPADRGPRIAAEEIVIDGAPLRRYPDRYWIRCQHHEDCQKYRGCGPAQCRNFGDQEPIGFLGAWHRLGAACPDARTHVHAVRPRLDQVEAFLRDNMFL